MTVQVGQMGKVSRLVTPSTPPVLTTSAAAKAAAAAAHAKALEHAKAVARAKVLAEQSRHAKQKKAVRAAASAKAAADAAMAISIRESINEPPNREIPKYGYQCMPGDEKIFEVCAGHKAWIDGQKAYDDCIAAGRLWTAAGKCVVKPQ